MHMNPTKMVSVGPQELLRTMPSNMSSLKPVAFKLAPILRPMRSTILVPLTSLLGERSLPPHISHDRLAAAIAYRENTLVKRSTYPLVLEAELMLVLPGLLHSGGCQRGPVAGKQSGLAPKHYESFMCVREKLM
jgi:hypothetical protein